MGRNFNLEICLHDLSLVESNHSVLYTAIADRVNQPSAKTMLLQIADDHHKCSVQLKEVAGEQLGKTTVESKGSEQEFAEVFGLAYDIYKEIIKTDEVPTAELLATANKFSILESALQEKYSSLQSKQTTPESLRILFSEAIARGTNHLKLLETLKQRIEMQEPEGAPDTMVIGCLPEALAPSLPHIS